MHNAFPHLPLYITENGIGTNDDNWRQRVLIDHLKMLHKAITEGVDIRGYFYWSLIDNFEWEHGYEPRFGLVHVDFKTQKRTIKHSGMVYAQIAKSNALPATILKKFPEEIYKPQF
jgi:beta-glucosidase